MPLSAGLRQLALVVAGNLVLAGAYFALAQFGLAYPLLDRYVSLFWPSAGVALAAIVLAGPALLPGVILGSFLVMASAGSGLLPAICIGLGNGLAVYISAIALQTLTRFHPALGRVHDVVNFVILGVVLPAAIASAIGVATLYGFDALPSARLGESLLYWFLGDAMGLLLLTPPILTVFSGETVTWCWRKRIEIAVLILAFAANDWVLFMTPLSDDLPIGTAVYLILPLLLWSALRFSPREVSFLNLIESGILLYFSLQGHGPFVHGPQAMTVLYVWAYAGSLSILALVLAASQAERRKAPASVQQLLGLSANSSGPSKLSESEYAQAVAGVVPPVTRVMIVTLVVMYLFEYSKQLLLPFLSPWEALLATVLFAAVVTALITSFVYRQQQELHLRVFRSTEKHRRLEEARKRLQRRHEVLFEIARLEIRDAPPAFQVLTELVSSTLNVNRVGIWLFNSDHSSLVCEDLYRAEVNVHERGLCLTAADYPRYFAALEHNLVIEADDACNDPRTSEFAEIYLRPNGITSMLDVPIWHNGRIVGTVCHEHTGPHRQWSAEEQEFAASVADYVGIILNHAERFRDSEALRSREEQLRQAQKMESIGHLAGGVAHDFNNFLSAIDGYAEMTLLSLNDNPDGKRMVERILEASTSGRSLIQQLLAFGRRQRLELKLVDVNAEIDSFQTILRSMLGDRIELTLALGAKPATIRADPTQFKQILLNLAINARDAMRGEGRLLIETSSNICPIAPIEVESDAFDTYVALRVTDSGAGMDASTQSRIFEPFFTTKELGHGTGLGLSTVFGIVKQHNGVIDCESTINTGTTFRIYFPLVQSTSIAPSASTTSEAIPHQPRGVQVLVVEDQEMVRSVVAEMLRSQGFTVHLAATPSEALAILNRESKIELVVTDVMLPEMDGGSLSAKMRSQYPEIRVLLMSGYTGDALGLQPADNFVSFIQKPFSMADFSRAIRRLLESSAASQISKAVGE